LSQFEEVLGKGLAAPVEASHLTPKNRLAETFKYLYLLFAPPETLDFDRVIITTEAHPIKRSV